MYAYVAIGYVYTCVRTYGTCVGDYSLIEAYVCAVGMHACGSTARTEAKMRERERERERCARNVNHVNWGEKPQP